jgi:superfamily II DNA or RNA helicase
MEIEQEAAGVLVASVQGSRSEPYRPRVRLERDAAGEVVGIDGHCDCPVGWNCKHVAAVVIAHAARNLHAAAPGPSVPPAIAAWLDQVQSLDARRDGAGEARSAKPPREVLLYVVSAEPDRPFAVRPMRVNIKKDDTLGKSVRLYDPERLLWHEPPAFVSTDDHRILRRLRLLGVGPNDFGRLALGADEELGEVLDRLVATGRGRWADPHGPVLTGAGERSGHVVWRDAEDGGQRAVLQDGDGAPLALLALTPPRYVEPASGATGPLALDLPVDLAAALVRGPVVPPAAAETVATRLGALRHARPPAPRVLEQLTREEVEPVPVLRLFALTARPLWAGYGRTDRPMPVAALRLAFAYDDHEVAAFPYTDPTVRTETGVVTYRRRLQRERAADARLAENGAERVDHVVDLDFERAAQPLDRVFSDGGDDWIDGGIDRGAEFDGAPSAAELALAFTADVVPALRAEGWRVEVEPSWPFAVHEGPVSLRATAGEGEHGLAVGLELEADGKALDLIPLVEAVVEALPLDEQGELPADFDLEEFLAAAPIWQRLDDGRHVRVDPATLAAVVEAVLRVRTAFGGFHPGEAHRVAELADALEGSGVPFDGGDEILALGRRLQALSAAPAADPPTGLAAELRAYQKTGYGWLSALRASGFGGVLADDMGLGKTVQTLALLAERHLAHTSDRPSLLIAPTSLLSTWRREAERFAPELKVLILQGGDRHRRFAEIGAHHLVVTTYPLLHRDHAKLAAQPWELAVLDEAQAVKNPASGGAKHIRTLEARMRLALTGTPMENNLGELWALFDWLVPGLLGDRKAFRTRFRTPIEKRGDQGAQTRLNDLVRPFVLRRTKDAVLKELPAKTEMTEWIRLGTKQRTLYETMRAAMDQRVRAAIAAKGLAASRITILDALLKLRQVCCDPALLPASEGAEAVESAKRARLVEMLDELVAEGRRVLVFSQFTKMLDLIEADIRAHGWDFARLTGETTDREGVVAAFQAGDVPIFLISLKAGGVGLTLTAADTVILYDPWWNPAVERQAMDRAHRIGQTKPVFVHKLVVEGAVEAAIAEMQAKKQALADALFDGPGDGPLALTEDDLAQLFRPLAPA